MTVPTVLVTGCAGYIGSVLTDELLSAGMKVIGVDNLLYKNQSAVLPYLGHPRYEFHLMDVLNSDMHQLVQRADVIIPLAALVGAPLCEKHPYETELVNCVAIANMMRLISPAQRIIYPNTNSGYGSTDGSRFCTEEDPMTPISVYGTTKCRAEKEVLNHRNGVVFRLATVFGASPRMRLDLMVNDFTVRLCEKRDIRQWGSSTFEIFEPHFKRNFVHVRDVARAFRFAICKPTMRGAYNLGLPEANLTKWELAETVCDTIGLSRRVLQVGNGRDPDQRNYLVSNDKILTTGFTFNYGLVQGIREVEAIYKLFSSEEMEKMKNI